MATDTAKVLETLGKMTVLELVELKNAIEEEWGVTAAAPMAVAATRMNEAASSHPMRVMVTPNRPNSFVARVITSGM